MDSFFIVYGNQEDPDGNAIPYHRTTQGSYWNKASKRYAAWKDYVRLHGRNGLNIPIKGTPKGRVTVKIYFGKENHADPDNIVKGILDALFLNDKHIDVTTHHFCKNIDPRLEIKVRYSE